MSNRPAKDHPDYIDGVRFYTVSVHKCPICRKQTNTQRQSQHGGRPNVACSQACADAIVGIPQH